MITPTVTYATFVQRFFAMMIDNIVLSMVLSPIFMMFFDVKSYTDAELQAILQTQGPMGLIDPQQMFIQQSIVCIITLFFWVRYCGTPGKRIMKLKIVDAQTGKPLTAMQSIVRYLGYFICAFPMGLGFMWMIRDKNKQGWHDKLANSVVIQTKTGLIDDLRGTHTDESHSSAPQSSPTRKHQSPIQKSDDDTNDTFAA